MYTSIVDCSRKYVCESVECGTEERRKTQGEEEEEETKLHPTTINNGCVREMNVHRREVKDYKRNDEWRCIE